MAKLTPVRAIRQKCLDCCNGQSAEVRLCTCKTCPLYGCRMGHRPKGEQFTTETYREEKSPRSLGSLVTERKYAMSVLDVITIFLCGVMSTLYYEYTHGKKW